MRVAILSDIHDNVWRLAAALARVQNTDALICCGDLCSPFVVHQMARGYERPIHIVFGNNDGDLYRITANAARYAHVQLHGELYRGEFGGRAFAVNHYDGIALEIAASGRFDVVCYGHNHVHRVHREGRTLAINPGAIMGAAIGPDGSWRDVPATFVIYDSATDEAETHDLGGV